MGRRLNSLRFLWVELETCRAYEENSKVACVHDEYITAYHSGRLLYNIPTRLHICTYLACLGDVLITKPSCRCGLIGMTHLVAPVLVPASRDMMVLFPTPSFPSTPTTRKSPWSTRFYAHKDGHFKGTASCAIPHINPSVLPVQALVHQLNGIAHLCALGQQHRVV